MTMLYNHGVPNAQYEILLKPVFKDTILKDPSNLIIHVYDDKLQLC